METARTTVLPAETETAGTDIQPSLHNKGHAKGLNSKSQN